MKLAGGISARLEKHSAMRKKNPAAGSWIAGAGILLCMLIVTAGCTGARTAGNPIPAPPWQTVLPAPGEGIHKIRHVIIIMQENRAFDEYFGTYPGADGIPMKNGIPAVCIPDPDENGTCVSPYHDPNDINFGGPHSQYESEDDINGGKMDGFIEQAEIAVNNTCNRSNNPGQCIRSELAEVDVMGYHDRREIPNYWAYADNYVLQDRMFESSASWSLPSHLFMVSAWSARCRTSDPMSCVDALQGPQRLIVSESGTVTEIPDYAWTDITYLLHRNNITWGTTLPRATSRTAPMTRCSARCSPRRLSCPRYGTPFPGSGPFGRITR
jgi:phospholipase C